MYESEIARLAEALSVVVRRNPEFGDVLAALGDLLKKAGPAERGGVGGIGARAERPAYSAPSEAEARPAAGGFDAEAGARRSASPRPPMGPVSLETISERCRLKAEATRWAIQRRVMVAHGGDFGDEISPRDAGLVERAKSLPNCFVWTLDPYAELPDDESLEIVAGCYEGLAVAAETMSALDARGADRDTQQSGMQLIAAAQSALRQSLFNAGRKQRDTDQEEAFGWLKDQTSARRIYVARHMRLMDPADPAEWSARIEETQQLLGELDEAGQQAASVQSLLNRIRYHAERIDAEDATRHDWDRVNESVRALVEDFDMAPDSIPLCEALELAVDLVPEDFEPGAAMRLALKACDAWLDTFEEEDGEEDGEEDEDAEWAEDEGAETAEERSV